MKAIIFDLDDTLIDRELAVAEFARQAFHLLESYVEDEGVFLKDVVVLDSRGYTPREEFFNSIQGKTGISDQTLLKFKELFYDIVWNKPIVVEGTIQSLEKIKSSGIKMGIITNGAHEVQLTKINNSGFHHLFDSIIISESFGSKKPDTSIFLAACEELGVAPGDSWFVGDHPVNDVWGSKQAGLNSAWLNRGNSWHRDIDPCFDKNEIGILEMLDHFIK